MLLHDLLNFSAGPRLRDKVSHGEISLAGVGSDVAERLLGLLLLCCSLPGQDGQPCQLTENISDELTENICQLTENISDQLTENISDQLTENICQLTENISDQLVPHCGSKGYESKYHPHSLLKQDLLKCCSLMAGWMDWPRVSHEELDFPQWKIFSMNYSFHLEPSRDTNSDIYKDVLSIPLLVTFIENIRLDVLYRPKCEIEFGLLVHRTVSCLISIFTETKESLLIKKEMFLSHQMRSRRRDTYKKMLVLLPRIVEDLNLLVFLLAFIYYFLNGVPDLTPSARQKISKVLKLILKHSENLVSYSNCNKWTEASNLSSQICLLIARNFQV